MNNYHFIIAGLPVLSSGGEDKSFSYKQLRDEIYSQCSKKDRALIDFFEKGFEEEELTRDFYLAALKGKNRFIREYFTLDLAIRNMKVGSVARKLYSPETAKEKIEAYSMDIPAAPESGDAQRLENIFRNPDIVEKEKQLDDFKWDKINEITIFDYFCIDSILAFLAKGKLVDRWNILDKEKGKELFKKLVDEVRGTYDKNKLSYTTDENNG